MSTSLDNSPDHSTLGEKEAVQIREWFRLELHDFLNKYHAIGLLGAEMLAEYLRREGSPITGQAENLVLQLRALYRELQLLFSGLELRLLFLALEEKLEQESFEKAIHSFAGHIRSHAQVDLQFQIDAEINNYPRLTKILFSVSKEAILNAMLHGSAKNIKVSVSKSDKGFALQIIDNGSGFNIDEKRFGYGIPIMTQLVKSVGGTISIWSKPNSGTTIDAIVPIA